MESDDLEPRVTSLEQQVRDLNGRVKGSEQDAAAARILAGAADRDVSGFRGELREIRGDLNDFRGEFNAFRQATIGSFNVMRQDFVDLRQDFVDLRKDFADLRGHVDRGFTEMRGKFDATASGQQQIVELLNTIIKDRPPHRQE